MRNTRSLVGFIDLTMILLGSVALIGNLESRDALRAAEIEQDADQPKGTTRPTSLIFEPGEARLSASGRQWLEQLAARGGGAQLTFAVAPGHASDGARLDGWEEAAARTASILHALRQHGYPADRLNPQLPDETLAPDTVLIRIDTE